MQLTWRERLTSAVEPPHRRTALVLLRRRHFWWARRVVGGWVLAVAWLATVAFLAGPIPALGAALVLALAPRRPWIQLLVVLVVGSVAAGAIVALEWRYDFPPGPDWPSRFAWTAPLVWMCVAAVTTVAIMPDGVKRAK